MFVTGKSNKIILFNNLHKSGLVQTVGQVAQEARPLATERPARVRSWMEVFFIPMCQPPINMSTGCFPGAKDDRASIGLAIQPPAMAVYT